MALFPRHAGHADMDMNMDGDSSHGSDSMGHMGHMVMVFQTERATPLYGYSWTPGSDAAYAGTCIFLILLAIGARVLLAARAMQEARWADADARRRYVAAHGKASLVEHLSRDADAKHATLSENGVEESVVVVARKGRASRPWRFSVDPLRALMDTVVAGVGYLLMLAVMTMNVGYCLSVLAGVFIGSLALGRYSAAVSDH